MYKTVRHGESSLQYTILPQDADSSSPSAAACTVTKHKTSSGRTAVLVAICVVLVGGVVAAVVVPLLVSARLVLPAPHRHMATVPARNAFTNTTTLTTTPSMIPSTVSASDTHAFNLSTVSEASVTTLRTTHETETTTTVRPWTGIAVSSTTTTTTPAPILTTTTPPPTWPPATTTEIQTSSSTTINNLSSSLTTNTSRPHKSWLPSRWPFVDPANTYAQWTELARQSALVPAACLGALVLAVLIALGACLITRRRRQKAHRRRTIGQEIRLMGETASVSKNSG